MSNFIDRFLDESEPWENGDYGQLNGHHGTFLDRSILDGSAEKAPLELRLSDELIEKLQELAVMKGLTFSAYINQVASDFRHGHGEII